MTSKELQQVWLTDFERYSIIEEDTRPIHACTT